MTARASERGPAAAGALRAFAQRLRVRVTSGTVEIAALAGVVAAAMILALAWTHLVPIFEAPDEPVHFDYAMSLAHAGRLISATEGPQPHGIADPVVRYLAAEVEVDRIAFHSLQRVTPDYGTPRYFRDVDAHAPRAGREYFERPGHMVPDMVASYPFGFYAFEAVVIKAASGLGLSGQFFAARAACTVLLGLALVFSYLTLRELRFPVDRALLITAVIGLLPLATFVGSYVQPDNLAFALVCAVFWAALRFKRETAGRRWPVVLGILLGLLSVTKTHVFAAVFVPVAGLCATNALRVPRAQRRWPTLATWLVAPAVALLAVQYCYVHPFWAHVTSLTFATMRNDALAHAYAARGLAGVAPMIWWESGAALNDFFGSGGLTALSFWGDFGWLDTPMVVVDPQVEGWVRAIVHVVTVCCVVAVALVVAGFLRDVFSIAVRGRPASAARLLFADPLTASYLLFGATLFVFYVLTANGFGAQGRDWIAFLLPITVVAVDVAPRALSRLRLRAGASVLVTCLLVGYVVVGTRYAFADVYHRYYASDGASPALGRVVTQDRAFYERLPATRTVAIAP